MRMVNGKALVGSASVNYELTKPLESLRQSPAALGRTLELLREELLTTLSNRDLSVEGKTRLAAEARARATDRINATMVAAEAAKSEAERFIASVLNDMPTDPTARLARMMEETQAWGRAERMLRGGASWLTLVQQAGQSQDLATLRALRSELPSWLYGQATPQEMADIEALISEAETPLLDPIMQRARELQAEITAGWPSLEGTAQTARATVAETPKGDTRFPLMFAAWLKGETISVLY